MTSPRSCWKHRPIPLAPAPSSISGWPISGRLSGVALAGAEFLTPPKVHSREIRCYMRDPDGHLIEVGQTTGVPT
jgi:hypothetical protein